MDKVELIPVERVDNVDYLALKLGCKVRNLSSSYLDLPLGAPFRSMTVWDGVENRFHKRLVEESIF